MEQIVRIYRTLFCPDNIEVPKKALIAWDRLCLPIGSPTLDKRWSDGPVCGTVANQASWIIKKVLKATTYMEATGSNDTAELKAKESCTS
ncbi:hypothetical protein KY285_026027 [Solanum tuberosum]|nr:hypothetical protein KY285_026027 [Solanum tuberosum]